MCVRVFSVGFGRTAGFPKKTGRPGLRRGGVGGYNLHSVPPNSPPDCGTVAHQPRAGCIRLVLHSLYRCRLFRRTPYASSPAIDGRVLIVVVRECIVAFGSVYAPRPILGAGASSVLCCCL